MAKKPLLAADTRPWRDPTARPFVRIRGVTKKFGDVAAVADVSLDIYKGELFCLLGGSGSGKSTLLRMLAGFEQPTSGRIEIDGQDMSGVPPYQRPINMMFQSYALFPHMTVEQNIGYGLRRDRLSREVIDARVAELLKLVKLDGYERRKPSQLSGGQRQRVALARALAKQPKLLLLDEPLGALDKKLREETQFELVKIQESLGVTFIVVTHDQEEAMSLATRIGVMNQGEIAMVGEPTEIYEFPNSRFVANFIGSANMVEGVVIEDEPDHVRLHSKELGTDIYVDHGVDCAPDQILWWAIRPEKLVLSRDKPAPQPGIPGDANIIKGYVEDIAYLGDMTVYQVRLDNGRYLRVTKANALRGDPDAISWDETVWATWAGSSGSVLVFMNRELRRWLAVFGITGRGLVIAAPAAWMTLFFLVPLAVVFGISLATKQFGQPPYSDLLTTESGTVQLTLHLSNYLKLIQGSDVGADFWVRFGAFLGVGVIALIVARAMPRATQWQARSAVFGVSFVAAALLLVTLYTAELNVYLTAFLSSIKIAAISTVFAILIGYPMAYAIARAPDRWRNILLMLVILPFWTSFLLRVYALSGFMRGEGVINNVLGFFHIPPLVMLQTDFAVYVGIVYSFLPFFILPLYTNLVKLDGSLLEASADLGSRPWQTFLSVTLPLSMPGVIAGSMLVFIPAMGEFVIPSLLGGPGTQMIGRILWDEFFSKTNWPRAAALAITMLIIVVIPIMLMQRAQNAVLEGR